MMSEKTFRIVSILQVSTMRKIKAKLFGKTCPLFSDRRKVGSLL